MLNIFKHPGPYEEQAIDAMKYMLKTYSTDFHSFSKAIYLFLKKISTVSRAIGPSSLDFAMKKFYTPLAGKEVLDEPFYKALAPEPDETPNKEQMYMLFVCDLFRAAAAIKPEAIVDFENRHKEFMPAWHIFSAEKMYEVYHKAITTNTKEKELNLTTEEIDQLLGFVAAAENQKNSWFSPEEDEKFLSSFEKEK